MASALSTASPGLGEVQHHTPSILLPCLTLPTTMYTQTQACARGGGVRQRQTDTDTDTDNSRAPAPPWSRGKKKGNLSQAYVMQRPITRLLGWPQKRGSQEEGHAHPPTTTTTTTPPPHSPHPIFKKPQHLPSIIRLPECPVCTKGLEDLRPIVLAPSPTEFPG